MKLIEDASRNHVDCKHSNCSCYNRVINENLLPFKSGITQNMINKIKDRGTKYQIVNNKLYRQEDCMFPSRCKGVEYFLLKAVTKLPDIEMIINVRDWPQVNKDWGIQGPIFSFSKTNESLDILYPAWSFWDGGPAISLYPTGLGRWDKHRSSIMAASDKYPWSKKKSKGFFRGSRTSSDRDELVLLSRQNPTLVDAQYTKNQAWKSAADTLNADPAKEVSLEDHCKYKYLFNFRGVAASFRFKHLFLCNSLVFHVGSSWIEFFYPNMKPWVHYVPVSENANRDEIEKLLKFFMENDTLAKNIAQKGFDFVNKHLRMEDIHCYWEKLLQKYAKLLKFEVKLDKKLIPIYGL
ncbi:O-glucosyltransferase rumi homolog [Ctenocephalides felis]|uniref:O-glucosyltransferase rumi homolog n=1 Tax=Ctenocephalides felis TaxID=7515 RepID=UPI000E6E499A|nr:O-glucosyltransferase rumi homolog [Ctenocephalides felis]